MEMKFPQTKFQQVVFVLLTVFLTVHCFVYYSLFVVNGEFLMAATGASTVLAALKSQGGVMMWGQIVPFWQVIVLEFILAMVLEMTLGHPVSLKIATRMFDPRSTSPVLFELAVIAATVAVMCPAMSLLAAFLYYPHHADFSLLEVLVFWTRLLCVNFPFALFMQVFLIQPVVRRLFRCLFR